MAKLPGAFNADDHGDMGFDPVPKDNYLLRIVESDYKENSKKTGFNLTLKMVVQEGKFKDRTFYRNLCLKHENPKAVEIAQRELATICRACGFPNGIDDSEELHGIDFIAAISVKKGTGDAADENKFDKYLPVEGGTRPEGGASSNRLIEDDEEDEAPAQNPVRNKPVFDEDED